MTVASGLLLFFQKRLMRMECRGLEVSQPVSEETLPSIRSESPAT
jgi:hypothetical protein